MTLLHLAFGFQKIHFKYEYTPVFQLWHMQKRHSTVDHWGQFQCEQANCKQLNLANNQEKCFFLAEVFYIFIQ